MIKMEKLKIIRRRARPAVVLTRLIQTLEEWNPSTLQFPRRTWRRAMPITRLWRLFSGTASRRGGLKLLHVRRRNISSGSGLRQAKCECAYVAPRCTRSQPLPAICASLLRTALQLCVARWRRQCPHSRPSRRAGTRRPPHASNAFLRPTLSPPMHTTTIITNRRTHVFLPGWSPPSSPRNRLKQHPYSYPRTGTACARSAQPGQSKGMEPHRPPPPPMWNPSDQRLGFGRESHHHLRDTHWHARVPNHTPSNDRGPAYHLVTTHTSNPRLAGRMVPSFVVRQP